MDKNELDKSLEARIMLLEENKEIDTSYAKKALKSHDINDLVTAIIEAKKLTSDEGKIWSGRLEEYYTNYYETDLDELIAIATNDYDALIHKALETNKVENMYIALEKLNEVDNPIYTYWYSRIDEKFDKKVGFKYKERPDVLQVLEKQVNTVKNTNNLAKTLETIELLKELIDFNELPSLTPLYEKWNKELNDTLKVNTESSYEEIKEEFNIKEENILAALNTLMNKKVKENADQQVDYNDIVLDTKDCKTLDDIYVKYSKEIEDEYQKTYSKITRLMQSVDSQMDVSDLNDEELKKAQDLRKAKYIFNQNRQEYNTEDDINEDEYREILKKTNEMYVVLEDNKNIDFKDSKQVFYWLQKLVPYINIHPITTRIGKPIDSYIIDLLKENGYTSEKIVVNDINSFYKNMISKELKELKDYHFFVSEYDQTDNERLTSDKVKEIANLNYHKEIYYEAERRLSHINKKLDSISELRMDTNINNIDKKKELETRLDSINNQIEDIHNLEVTSKIFKTEDTEAKIAYEKAKENPELNTVTDMFNAMARLHDKSYKDKMLIVGYELLDKLQDDKLLTNKEIDSIEKSNKLIYIKRKNIDDIIEEKKDIEEDLSEFNDKLVVAFDEINETEKLLNEEKVKYENIVKNSKIAISEVASSLKEKGYVDKSEEFKNIDIEDEKEGILDKFKNFFNRNKQNNEIVSISQDDETLKDVVAVRKIKPIKKSLYVDVNQPSVKEKISKGIKEAMNELKKHPIAYSVIAFSYIASAALVTNAITTSASEKKEEPVLEEIAITDIEIPYTDNGNEVENIVSKK